MKKILVILTLSALVALTLTSCGEEKEDTGSTVGSGTASTMETSSEEGLVIGGVIDDASDWGPVIGLD